MLSKRAPGQPGDVKISELGVEGGSKVNKLMGRRE